MKTLNEFHPDDYRVSNPKRKLHHIFTAQDVTALWAAYAAQRPLLVRGKPGTGKSQMAKAIADHLGWAFVSHVVRGDTELSDLHWSFDAVARLGEAQAQGGNSPNTSALDPQLFLSPGAFWWAYDWQTASTQYNQCHTKNMPQPYAPKSWRPGKDGVVLLIDEIDKANPDLPNGLLETIGDLSFTVPYLGRADKDDDCANNSESEIQNPIKGEGARVLIVITTNEERELPQAFVRRCFVHELELEKRSDPIKIKSDDENGNSKIKTNKREQWLVDRGQLHFGGLISQQAYYKAAEMLWKDRDRTVHRQYPPGLAEYIDILNVLRRVEDKNKQADFIDKIASYAYSKELKT